MINQEQKKFVDAIHSLFVSVLKFICITYCVLSVIFCTLLIVFILFTEFPEALDQQKRQRQHTSHTDTTNTQPIQQSINK